MKRRRKCFVALLLTAAWLLGSVLDVSAITTVNLDGEDGTVVSVNSTGDFQVTLKAETDDMVIYKVATMSWDSENATYTALAWTDAVLAWLEGDGAAYAAYSTPAELAESSVQDEFYRALAASIAEGLKDGSDSFASDAVSSSSMSQQEGTSTWNVTNQTLGQYLVLAKTSANSDYTESKYAPLTVNLVPEQVGPSGNWILGEVSVSPKFDILSLDKTINGYDDYDTVAIGDTVTFTIELDYPVYGDEVDDGIKFLQLDDDLSSAFTIDTSTLKITYIDENGDEVELDSAYYNAVIEDSSNVVVYGCSTSGHEYYRMYATPVGSATQSYYYKDRTTGRLNYLGQFSSTSAARSAYVTAAGDTINHTTVTITDEPTSLFLIDFDCVAIDEAGINISSIIVTYEATVNEDAEVGSDANTNTAILYYLKNADGDETKVSDEVTAYTYGINLKKLDGDDGTALAGAEFELYRGVAEYCTLLETEDESGNTDYSYYCNADGTELTDDELAEAYQTYATYNALIAGLTGSILNTSVVTVQKTTICSESSTAHTHLVVYELYDGDIESVSDESGLDILGLDCGIYYLQETVAPSGYNLAKQALLFEIWDLDEDTADGTYGGSHSAFEADDGTIYVDGIYPIEVLNYTGITLPETGGMGTYLFTALGVVLMFGALILIVVKNKKKRSPRMSNS